MVQLHLAESRFVGVGGSVRFPRSVSPDIAAVGWAPAMGRAFQKDLRMATPLHRTPVYSCVLGDGDTPGPLTVLA